jgi:hypothetical protein
MVSGLFSTKSFTPKSRVNIPIACITPTLNLSGMPLLAHKPKEEPSKTNPKFTTVPKPKNIYWRLF